MKKLLFWSLVIYSIGFSIGIFLVMQSDDAIDRQCGLFSIVTAVYWGTINIKDSKRKGELL